MTAQWSSWGGLRLGLGPAAPLGCRSSSYHLRLAPRPAKLGGERREGGGEGRRQAAAYTRLPVPPLRAAQRPLLAPLLSLPPPLPPEETAWTCRPTVAPPGNSFLAPGFLCALPLPLLLLFQEKENNRPAKKNHVYLSELLKCLPGREGRRSREEQPKGPRAGVDGETGGVGALRGGKLRAADTRRCSATARGAVCLGQAAARCVRTRERAGSAEPGRTPPPAARTLSVVPEEEEEYGIEGGLLLPSGLLPLDLRCCPSAR